MKLSKYISKYTFGLALALVGSKSLASQVYEGKDNKGRPCSLEVIRLESVMDEEIKQKILKGYVKVNYSEQSLPVSQSVSLNDNDQIQISPDLSGGLYDEYQGEVVKIKLNASQTPIAYTYYNNNGLRYFKPINVQCDLSTNK